MTKLLINTIAKEGEPGISQIEFLEQLGKLRLPISGVEVRREMFSSQPSERRKELAEVWSLKKKHGWEMMYSVPESLFLEEGINPDLNLWLEELAAFEGVSMKVNTGDVSGLTKVSETFKQMITAANCEIRIENDQTPENGTLTNVKHVLKMIQETQLPIGYTYDLGNWQVMGEDPEAAWEEVQKYTTVIHLKNMDSQGKAVLLDEKSVNWSSIIKNQPIVILEYPMSFAELSQEVRKVQNVIN